MSSSRPLLCGQRALDLSRPKVMGIINTTPDSFSDGGDLFACGGLDLDKASYLAEDMLAQGAAILDIGGESTRPGAAPVSEQEELARVIPLVERIAANLDVIISVDTSSPVVMAEAVSAGAGLINDVRALSREGALEAVAATHAAICLMHMQGTPQNMQTAPQYGEDVVAEVQEFLQHRIRACVGAGISSDRIVVDPGFGFGKTLEHNLELLGRLEKLQNLGFPVLVGLSRKSIIGKLLGRGVAERMPASIALALLAVERGASIVRAHDVAATVDALAMFDALQGVY